MMLVYRVMLTSLPEAKKALLRQFCPIDFFKISDEPHKHSVVIQLNGQFHAVAIFEETDDFVNWERFAVRTQSHYNMYVSEILNWLNEEIGQSKSIKVSKDISSISDCI